MFSELDNIIFPDGCEVIETVPSQHYVYPIFKCGRSSLTESMKDKGWKFVTQDNIKKISCPITVFLRDPRERFISGVNTFLQQLHRKDHSLDQHTVLYFVNQYLFLNRHYAPQFHWLLNLMRFSGPNVLIKLEDFKNIKSLTAKNSKAGIQPVSDSLQKEINKLDWEKLELYFFLDQILIDKIGQTVTMAELINHVKTCHPELYKLVFQKTIDRVNVLSEA